jgi:hypothetical protein
MSRPEPWDNPDPERYEVVAVPSSVWRLVTGTGKTCRAGAGHHNPACGRSAVAEFNRRTYRGQDRWWPYCELHMSDRWIENGQVMTLVSRPTAGTP